MELERRGLGGESPEVEGRSTSVVDHAGRRPDPEAIYHCRSSETGRGLVVKLRMFVGAVALLTAVPMTVLAQDGVDPRPPNGATQKPAVAGQTDVPERKSNV